MPTLQKTNPSTPRLSDLARYVVAPKGAVSTGWPAVAGKCRELGITFRPWQPGVGRLILAKRADGKYAATIGGTGLSIPRQVGKTFLVGAIVFALCLLHPNLTVIWTAHRLRTAEETFGKMQAFARRKRIAPFVEKVVLGSGEEAILFRNRSRILFGARESGFGLGFDEVDVLIFDEAQRLKDATLDDMVPATNQSRQPTSALLLFMGTPPRPTDAGEVFGRMRREALTGEDDDTGWVEFGADEDFKPTLAPAPLGPADWAQIAKANPSYPQDTPREAILRMRKKLGPESFLREGLGIWDKPEAQGAIPTDLWKQLADSSDIEQKAPSFGVATAPDRSWSAIAVAWRRPDGLPQVMVSSYRPDATWVEAEAERLRTTWHGQVYADDASRGLVADAEYMPPGRRAQADNAFYDAVLGAALRHGNQPEMNTSVRASRWKPWGTTRILIASGETDISPLRAASLALHGLAEAGDPNIW